MRTSDSVTAVTRVPFLSYLNVWVRGFNVAKDEHSLHSTRIIHKEESTIEQEHGHPKYAVQQCIKRKKSSVGMGNTDF